MGAGRGARSGVAVRRSGHKAFRVGGAAGYRPRRRDCRGQGRREPVDESGGAALAFCDAAAQGKKKSVCGVVYQNAHRHLACQFTFACEGKDLSRIDELDMWEQAKRIAKDVLDGKIWLTEVGHATHYHAYWVHPSWVHEMKKMYQLGVHTFYRPRAWGDGSDAPVWGTVPATPKPAGGSAQNSEPDKEPAAAVRSPDATVKIPQAAASPASDNNIPTAKL